MLYAVNNHNANPEKSTGGELKDSTLSKEEILTANFDDFLISAGGYNNDQRVLDALYDVARIVEVTKNIAGSSHEVFKHLRGAARQPHQSQSLAESVMLGVHADFTQVGEVFSRFKSLALSIIAGISTDFDRIGKLFPAGEFNPYFKLFKDQLRLLVPGLPEENKLLYPVDESEWVESVVKLNQFVDAVRHGSKQESFIKNTQHHVRNSNKNQTSLNKFIGRLFDHRSRLLVIRVDLEYGREYGLGSGSPISWEETDMHRKAFLNDLRNDICKKSFVGYVWKLEYGLKNSFHYHFLIFLDAAIVRQDVRIAQRIGEHWKNKVTGGKGRYWNCNAGKNSYRNCGIGVIPHNDPVLRKNLDKAASYLIKADYFIRSAIPPKRRVFGKGSTLPKVKSNRGRPRGK